ncbi:MAG: TonB-dependent receptor [Saprospiraceae bacterium]|nr:TonB-dependent receptor [Saprospiraceae bacterium]
MKVLLKVSMILFFCLMAAVGFAQNRTIAGTVVSADDQQPLVGVSVVVKGTSNGTITDVDGKYSLSVPEKSILVFSYVGYVSAEETLDGRSSINVSLKVGADVLNELVVTGYGTQLKRTLTGNIAKIKSKDLQDVPVTSVDQALQGKAAGVQINAGTGKLGQASQIRIRGQSSVSASNEPLFVVDGVPITNNNLSIEGGATNPLSDININDIESLEILKDASAAAIYGARGANGVILITTKRGKSGKTTVTFGAQYGNSKPTRKVQFLNTQQYIDYYLKAAANSDRIEGLPVSDPDSYTTYMEGFLKDYSLDTYKTGSQFDTNWGDLSFQDAPHGQYDLGIQGGNEKTTFYMSGQFLDQKGILIGNAFNRMSGRVSVDHKAFSWLKVGISTNITRSLNNRLSGDRQFDNPMQMVALPPIAPAINPNTGLPTGSTLEDLELPNYYNPLINLGNAYYNATVHRNLSQAYGQVFLLPGLDFRSELALDLLNQQEEQYYNSRTQRNFSAPNGYGLNRFVRVENYNWDNYLTYNKDLGKIAVNAVLGMGYQQSQTKRSFIEGQDFPSDSYKYIASAARKTDGSSSQTDFRFVSYFGRTNFNLFSRFLVGLSARVDGSSRFGVNNRYGFFPSASLGWVMTEESFLKSVKPLSFLKLRASYGRTGNADVVSAAVRRDIDNFPQLGLFTGDAAYGALAGQRPSQLANPDLSWETTNQFDGGIDFGFFKDRITGEVDYYIKKTSGLLLNVNVPGTSGFSTQFRNVGKLENKGVEVVLNTNNLVGDFKWTTTFNFAANRNKITDLQGQIIEGGLNNMSRAVEGQPLGVYFTAEYAGVDPANGDALWYKNTKNTDGTFDRTTTNTYSQAQRVVVGSPLPKWIGSLGNTFSYKGFDLRIFFNGVFGNKLNWYGVGRFSSANGRFEDNQTVDQLNSWTKDNTNTNIPEARLFYNNGAQPSSRFIVDGQFIRLRELTLSYNLPKSLIQKANMSNCRVFVTGLNLATFTKYVGWDPEVNADDIVTNIAQGYDFYTAPQPKTLLFGLNVAF